MKIKKIDRITDYKSIADNKEINDELVNSPDRVAALLGASILELQLERLIGSFLVDDHAEVRSFLSNESQVAPLSTFAAKIRAAYCLGLICKEELIDLTTIKNIRNIFAHHLFDCDFLNEKIVVACDDFQIFSYAMKKPEPSTPRVRFNIAICVLEGLLSARAKTIIRREKAVHFRRGK